MTYDNPTQGDKLVFKYQPNGIDFRRNNQYVCTFTPTLLKHILKGYRKWSRKTRAEQYFDDVVKGTLK